MDWLAPSTQKRKAVEDGVKHITLPHRSTDGILYGMRYEMRKGTHGKTGLSYLPVDRTLAALPKQVGHDIGYGSTECARRDARREAKQTWTQM